MGLATHEEMVLGDAGATNSMPVNVTPGPAEHAAADRATEPEAITTKGRVEQAVMAPALVLEASAATMHVMTMGEVLAAMCDVQTSTGSPTSGVQMPESNQAMRTPMTPTAAIDNQSTTPSTDPMPTATEAAHRLSKFANDVQKKRQTPLIKSPPKQMPPAKKAPIPI